ncbi:alcohol dehydrogenase [Staphylotrichum tortipilum]|uniref:Alcohol dehydrogenase n=1 Tax=Staphylotrichum tortipilum TaxID=2831512 RepID=A0AAN6MMV8_9PEZI|nr:alcohol dehydrogenase [Staphylotrichum longicolle]
MGSLPYRLPPTQTAVITTVEGKHAVSHDRAVPRCGPTSVLVRVRAVALNPTDHKTPARVKTAGLTAGCDFAGEVVQVGELANEEPGANRELPRRWAPGDRVFGVVYGSNPGAPDWGAFADFVEADPVMLCRVPEGWDWATAAALGGSVHGSVALCLFGYGGTGMGLDMGAIRSADLKKVVLVYGGSTACGTMALQILRLAGYIPITTCSPHNASLATSYGASATFDYRLPTCADAIKRHTLSALPFALDCIGTAQSAALCYAALGRAGGRYVALEKYPDSVAALRKVVRPSWVMGPVMFGRELQLGEGYSQPADPAAREFARAWYPLAEALLGLGNLRSHPVRVARPEGRGEGWPEAVVGGLAELREGKVSAQKLVVKMSDV